ncbi:nucleoside transporter-domain-containing protein, partial [Pavlovales sp. CCMP2436]
GAPAAAELPWGPANGLARAEAGGAPEPCVDGESARACGRALALARIRRDGLALVWTFGVTLSIFPTVISRIEPLGFWPVVPLGGAAGPAAPSALYRALFVPSLFVLFNAGDLLGRWLAALLPLVSDGRRLLALSCARLAFVPVTVACVLSSRAASSRAASGVGAAAALLPAELGDGPALALLLLLGASNGYCASCAFMAAPLRVVPAEMEWVGRAMPLFLNVGLTLGSLVALLIERVVDSK